MTHGLIFNGIDIDGGQDAVGQVVKRAVAVHMRLTETTLTVTDPAPPQTQVTTGGTVVLLFLQPGFDELVLLRCGHGHTLIISSLIIVTFAR